MLRSQQRAWNHSASVLLNSASHSDSSPRWSFCPRGLPLDGAENNASKSAVLSERKHNSSCAWQYLCREWCWRRRNKRVDRGWSVPADWDNPSPSLRFTHGLDDGSNGGPGVRV